MNYKLYILILIIFAINCNYSLSQCGCPGNSGSVGIIPLSELSNIDSMIIDNIFISAIFKNNYSDTYYKQDTKIGKGAINNYSANYTALRIGYKPINRLLFETEIGYFINKSIDEGFQGKYRSNGFSDLTLFSRYTFYKNLQNGLDFSLGTGFKIPISKGDSIIQYIQPSTDAYAILFNFVGKIVFSSINSGIILAHRTDINFTNKYSYRYGNSLVTSLFFLNNIYENLVIGIEIKNDIRLKDYNHEIKLNESGMMSFTLSPVLRYSFGDIVLNAFFDFPVYQYFNTLPAGQIGNKYSIGFGVSYNTRLK